MGGIGGAAGAPIQSAPRRADNWESERQVAPLGANASFPPSMRSVIHRTLLAVVAAAALSCKGESGGAGPGPGPILPEPFPDCPADRICTFTLELRRNYTPAYQSTLAKFDFVITNLNGFDTGLAAAVSPDVPLVMYEPMRFRSNLCPTCEYEDWPTLDMHEDWFLHDALGNRVQDDVLPAWYMDYRNTEYLDYLVARFLSLKGKYPEMDGVFMDQHGPYSGFTMFAVPRMRPNPISPLPTEAQFDQDNIAAAAYVKSRVGTLHVILNSNSYPGFNGVVDGSMDEGFAHDNFAPDTTYMPEWFWKGWVERLADPSAAGKFLFPYTKSIGSAEARRIMRYGLASYLLGRRVDGHAFFCFQADTDPLPPWFPEYDTPTGAPLGTYYQDASGLWVREYANGIAVVHADFTKGDLTLPLTGSLAGTYVDWDGSCYTGAVVIPPNTGHFLLRSNCVP